MNRQKILLIMLGLVAAPLGAEQSDSVAEQASEPTPVSFDSPSYKRRPYQVTVGIRQEYDDNINTTEFDPQSSFKTIVEPEIALNIPDSRTFLGLRYRNSTVYYWDRAGEDFDFGHFFDLSFNHEFTQRFSVDLTENFRFSQEPEITENNSIFRRQGDFIQNSAEAGASYYLTRRLFLSVRAGHNFWDYDDPFLSVDLDRQVFTTGGGVNFLVSPLTLLSANYDYVLTEYETSPRDSDSHMAYLGVLHTFTPQWSARAQAGAEYRKAESFKGEYAPFAAVSTSYQFLPGSSVTAGYNTSLQDTDASIYNFSESHRGYISLTSQLSYDLKLETGADFVLSEYSSNQQLFGLPTDAEETTLVYRITLLYRITPQMFADLGYSFTTVESDFIGRSYDRNLVSAGIKYVY